MKWIHLACRVEPDWKSRPRFAEEALRNIGVDVTQIDRGLDTPHNAIPAIRARILEQVETKMPEVLFIEGGAAAVSPPVVTPEFLKKIRPLCGTILLWWGEVRSRPLPAIVNLAPHVDRMLLVSAGQKRVYEQYGFKRVEEFHWTLPKSAVNSSEGMKSVHVFFAGTNYHRQGYPLSRERMQLMDAFNKAIQNFHVMGAGWERRGIRNLTDYDRSLVRVRARMRSSCIVLGMNSFDLTNYYPRRTWEALSSGSCYLVRHIPGMERDFQEHRQLVTFRTIAEAIDKAKHILENNRWRDIGRAGQQLFRGRWTLEHTFERLVASLP